MTKALSFTLLLLAFAPGGAHAEEPSTSPNKPKVWIISDGADGDLKRQEGKPITDQDDISAMAAYLLMSNEFDTRGITIGGTFNAKGKQCEISMKAWADELFLSAYKADLPALNKHIGGYQEEIRFLESFVWANSERYSPEKAYESLDPYPSVKALFDEAETIDDTLNVLTWGPQTEAAILVNYCRSTGRNDVLRKLRFISHWTHSHFHLKTPETPPWQTHNAKVDAKATAYMKEMATAGHVTFHECAAIGQAGLVDGSPKGQKYYDQFRVGRLGTVYVEGKYSMKLKTVDDSDSCTFWVLLGDWGVSLNDIQSNGENDPETERKNEEAFFKASPKIRAELLRRARAAANGER